MEVGAKPSPSPFVRRDVRQFQMDSSDSEDGLDGCQKTLKENETNGDLVEAEVVGNIPTMAADSGREIVISESAVAGAPEHHAAESLLRGSQTAAGSPFRRTIQRLITTAMKIPSSSPSSSSSSSKSSTAASMKATDDRIFDTGSPEAKDVERVLQLDLSPDVSMPPQAATSHVAASPHPATEVSKAETEAVDASPQITKELPRSGSGNSPPDVVNGSRTLQQVQASLALPYSDSDNEVMGEETHRLASISVGVHDAKESEKKSFEGNRAIDGKNTVSKPARARPPQRKQQSVLPSRGVTSGDLRKTKVASKSPRKQLQPSLRPTNSPREKGFALDERSTAAVPQNGRSAETDSPQKGMRRSLYELGTLYQRRHALWVQAQKENRERRETMECTFEPVLCEQSKRITEARVAGMLVKLSPNRHHQCAQHLPPPNYGNEDDAECTFVPLICPASRHIVLNNEELAAASAVPVAQRLHDDYIRRERTHYAMSRVALLNTMPTNIVISEEQKASFLERNLFAKGTNRSISRGKRVKEQREEKQRTSSSPAKCAHYTDQEVKEIVERLAKPPPIISDEERSTKLGLKEKPQVGVISHVVRSIAVEECLASWHSFMFEQLPDATAEGKSPRDHEKAEITPGMTSLPSADEETPFTLREHIVSAILSPRDWIANDSFTLQTTRIILGALERVAPSAVDISTLTGMRSYPLRQFVDRLTSFERAYGPQSFTRKRPAVERLRLTCPPPPRRSLSSASVKVPRVAHLRSASSQRSKEPNQLTAPQPTSSLGAEDGGSATANAGPQASKSGIDLLCEEVEALLGDCHQNQGSNSSSQIPSLLHSSPAGRGLPKAETFNSSEVFLSPMSSYGGDRYMPTSPPEHSVPPPEVRHRDPFVNYGDKRLGVSEAELGDHRRDIDTSTQQKRQPEAMSLVLLCAQVGGRKVTAAERRNALRQLGALYAHTQLSV